MTEAELLELLTEGVANVLALVSIYFTVVSAYLAAIYYFLNKAPVIMRLVAFIMFSGAMLFLGLAAVGVERMLAGQFYALEALPERVAPPPDNAALIYFGMEAVVTSQYQVGVWLGWIVAGLVYVSCLYLTFLHPWKGHHAREAAS